MAYHDTYINENGKAIGYISFCDSFFLGFRAHVHLENLPNVPFADPAQMGSDIDAMTHDGHAINTESGASILLHGKVPSWTGTDGD